MSSHLSRRRKQELRDIAKSLGLADNGTREEIYDRIKEFVAAQPNDVALREILGEDISSEIGGPTLTSSGSALSSANNSRRSSLATTTHNTRSSPTKKSTAKETRAMRSSGGGSGRNSSEATHGLQEHQVHGFMNHVQSELHHAKDLAKQLEETLHSKFSSKSESSSSARRGSQSQHPMDQGASSTGRRSSKDHGDGQPESSVSSLRHRRRRSYDRVGVEEEDGGLLDRACKWGHHWVGEIKHRFVECTGNCSFVSCAAKPWKMLHDLGSTSTGFVWLTLLLEVGVFLSQAHSHFQATHEHHHDERLYCLSFFTNWADFLYPFFSYYGTLFVIPTLLSQLFNVDGSRVSRSNDSSSSEQHHHHHTPRTGLLSEHKFTTSALSYFVFKFALTYFLGQSQGLGSLMGHVTGGGLWGGCKYISQIFRYVPQSLGLATSGAGTVLALAESIVTSAANKRR